MSNSAISKPKTTSRPRVVVCMGSQSDWDTMREAANSLESLAVPHEVRIISAHRTPDRLAEFARGAAADGVAVIIAGARETTTVTATVTTATKATRARRKGELYQRCYVC